MRLSTRGRGRNLTTPVVGRITTAPGGARDEAVFITQLQEVTPEDLSGYRAIITASHGDRYATLLDRVQVPTVHSVRETDHLRNGDLVALDPHGGVRTLYRPDSVHNTLFVTERCNSNCLMCSQPPKDHDDTKYLLHINQDLVRLIPSQTTALGITGGEPTLLRDDLWALLELLKEHLPTTHLHLLTNGRLFAWPEFTHRFAAIDHPDLVLGIPLYSDAAVEHDYIVQARGAFDQTLLGLHQLARWKQHIELRVVLHRLTIPRLSHLAEYVCRNIPFVEHVALMGLEPTGYTPYHREKLWIDPYDYQTVLEEAVEFLSIRGMHVSVYNLPRCLLPRSLWKFARQSISDWKNVYLPQCEGCAERPSCAGFFQTADKMHSAHVHPL